TNTVAVDLPATVSFTYDENGNLLSDGRRLFGYDDENQLITSERGRSRKAGMRTGRWRRCGAGSSP
ncbi:MAG TPA: hypothetical protein P5534_22135, partial [Candidatus Paceibacterota bacterium]|nr:hypothetical protein [Candidatus Paceibacterota bacterium]